VLQVLVGLLPRHPAAAGDILRALTALLLFHSGERRQFARGGGALQLCQLLRHGQLHGDTAGATLELLCLVCARLHADAAGGALLAASDP
jgi:hypothetical protein